MSNEEAKRVAKEVLSECHFDVEIDDDSEEESEQEDDAFVDLPDMKFNKRIFDFVTDL